MIFVRNCTMALLVIFCLASCVTTGGGGGDPARGGAVAGGGGGGGATGGGGGESGIPAPAPIIWLAYSPPTPFGAGTGSPISSADEAFSVGSKAMPATTREINFSQVNKTTDGLTLSFGGSMSGWDRSVTLSVAAGDFKENADGFITAVKESTGRFTNNTSVSYLAKDTVILGGKKTGLSYSEFGFWESLERIVGDGQPPDGGSEAHMFTAFHMGEPPRAIGGVGLGAPFTGHTVAMRHGGGQSPHALTGTAAITITSVSGSGSMADLSLDFTDYYTISIPLSVTGGGALSASGMASVSGSSGSKPEILNGFSITTLSGQFYGAGSPSEAVGQYYLQSIPPPLASPNFIQGSFGVKR